MNNVEHENMFKMKFLVDILNKYAEAYYNGTPIATDEEYDKMYNMLESFEKTTGCKLSNSPINKVGFKAQDSIKKAKHTSPMLSLKKIHSIEEIKEFMNDHECIMSAKEDGLTIRLTYHQGKLIKAETRGDGIIGNDITYNIIAFQGVPLEVKYDYDFVIDGEAIVTDKDFQLVNEGLDEPFKLQRSLASGSVSLLDPEITKTRRLTFIAWKFVSGHNNHTYYENFKLLENLGFSVVPYCLLDRDKIENQLEQLKENVKKLGHPIDGMVITYNNIEYGESLGRTEHHFNNGVAYKFEDEVKETILKDIEWSMGRTGDLTPVAVFEPVIIDGTEVNRASCHNLTYLKNMCLGIGDKIGVYKANMIIPQIKVNYTNQGNLTIPYVCPYCGVKTIVRNENSTSVLHCPNDFCSGKTIGKFTHFVSKPAMNIEGISESTIQALISIGVLHTFKDLYHLSEHMAELTQLKGYGPKKIKNMLNAIENSRKCKLENFIVAMGIPLIGKTASKIISEVCEGSVMKWRKSMVDEYDWSFHDGIGKEMTQSMYNWYLLNLQTLQELVPELEFIVEEKKPEPKGVILQNQTFCITGSLVEFKNREECENYIISNGGQIVSGVSKKTNYLICNEASSSSKYKKAQTIGIPIITEQDLKNMIGG